MPQRPLVSFVLLAYQQERFVREAVRSALAQAYEPLEIILSDDCSPDRTFEIMEEETEAYRGPHEVILHRNETNRGLAENLNNAWGLAHGEFIVVQGGDDISLPQRTQVLVETWRQPPQVDCVYSDVARIDGRGVVTAPLVLGSAPKLFPGSLEGVVRSRWCAVWGCSAGYSRSLLLTYGGLHPAVLAEDRVLSFWALLSRGIRYCEQVLVKYRTHENNLFAGTTVDCRRSRHKARQWAISEAVTAAEWVRAWDMSGPPRDDLREMLVSIERQRRYEALAYDVLRRKVPSLAIQGLAEGLSLRNAAGLIQRHFLRI